MEGIILSCGIHRDIYVARITGSLRNTDGFSLRAPSGGMRGLLSLLFYDDY